MTAAVAIALIILALLDGAFCGFRASVGRTGLVNHRQSDYQAALRGAVLVCVLLAPAIALVCADVIARPANLGSTPAPGKSCSRSTARTRCSC